MKTIKMIHMPSMYHNVDRTYNTLYPSPAPSDGDVFQIEGTNDLDGMYVAKQASYDSSIGMCSACPFSNSQMNGLPYCRIYRKVKSGNSHPICVVDARAYWPKMSIRRLDAIMEDL